MINSPLAQSRITDKNFTTTTAQQLEQQFVMKTCDIESLKPKTEDVQEKKAKFTKLKDDAKTYFSPLTHQEYISIRLREKLKLFEEEIPSFSIGLNLMEVLLLLVTLVGLSFLCIIWKYGCQSCWLL